MPATVYPLTGAGVYGAAAFPSDHRYPGELPPFFATGHSFEHIGVAEDVAFERGEDRSRQIYTFNPQLVNITTELTQAQFDVFDAWFENDLCAGACRFDVLVASQGGTGVSWWTSQFVETYKWEAFGWYYAVTARLLLLDGPYASRVDPTLRGAMTLSTGLAALSASGSVLRGLMDLTTTLSAQPVLPTLRGRVDLTTTTLSGFLGNSNDRRVEDGQGRTTEHGEARTTE